MAQLEASAQSGVQMPQTDAEALADIGRFKHLLLSQLNPADFVASVIRYGCHHQLS